MHSQLGAVSDEFLRFIDRSVTSFHAAAAGVPMQRYINRPDIKSGSTEDIDMTVENLKAVVAQ